MIDLVRTFIGYREYPHGSTDCQPSWGSSKPPGSSRMDSGSACMERTATSSSCLSRPRSSAALRRERVPAVCIEPALGQRGSVSRSGCDAVLVESVYEAAGGREGLLALAAAWHRRVLDDEVVSHAFSHGYHPEHTERLAAYWAEALGGPPAYSEAYGDETSVVQAHSGNGEHREMDERAIACFDLALADVGLSEDDRARQALHAYFAWATTTTMAHYHESADDVPDGLTIPHWSWDGLVEGTSPDGD